MKTKNNVQKTVTRPIAFLLGSFILCANVLAQEPAKVKRTANDSSRQILAINTLKNSVTNLSEMPNRNVSISLFDIVTEQDAPLEIESWMTNDKNFQPAFNEEIELDAPIEIEYWMKDQRSFELNPVQLKTDLKLREGAIIISGNNKFGRRLFLIMPQENEAEPKLEIEPWMIDATIWNRK